MSNVKPKTLPEEYIMPIQKERRGYAKHFQEVYMPLLESWFAKYQAHFHVKVDKKTPMWMCMVQAQPWMLNALPSAVLAKHSDEIEAMIRLHAVAAPSIANANADEEYWKTVDKRRLADHGKAFAIGMWMYRAGYNKVTFDFRGGGDEGWVENPTIHGRDVISLEDDDAFECMGTLVSSSENIKNWCYDIMPQGFGDGDPYYEDGKGIITLRDMRFSLECLVEVRRSERCEGKGSIVSGIIMPYPED